MNIDRTCRHIFITVLVAVGLFSCTLRAGEQLLPPADSYPAITAALVLDVDDSLVRSINTLGGIGDEGDVKSEAEQAMVTAALQTSNDFITKATDHIKQLEAHLSSKAFYQKHPQGYVDPYNGANVSIANYLNSLQQHGIDPIRNGLNNILENSTTPIKDIRTALFSWHIFWRKVPHAVQQWDKDLHKLGMFFNETKYYINNYRNVAGFGWLAKLEQDAIPGFYNALRKDLLEHKPLIELCCQKAKNLLDQPHYDNEQLLKSKAAYDILDKLKQEYLTHLNSLEEASQKEPEDSRKDLAYTISRFCEHALNTLESAMKDYQAASYNLWSSALTQQQKKSLKELYSGPRMQAAWREPFLMQQLAIPLRILKNCANYLPHSHNHTSTTAEQQRSVAPEETSPEEHTPVPVRAPAPTKDPNSLRGTLENWHAIIYNATQGDMPKVREAIEQAANGIKNYYIPAGKGINQFVQSTQHSLNDLRKHIMSLGLESVDWLIPQVRFLKSIEGPILAQDRQEIRQSITRKTKENRFAMLRDRYQPEKEKMSKFIKNIYKLSLKLNSYEPDTTVDTKKEKWDQLYREAWQYYESCNIITRRFRKDPKAATAIAYLEYEKNCSLINTEYRQITRKLQSLLDSVNRKNTLFEKAEVLKSYPNIREQVLKFLKENENTKTLLDQPYEDLLQCAPTQFDPVSNLAFEAEKYLQNENEEGEKKERAQEINNTQAYVKALQEYSTPIIQNAFKNNQASQGRIPDLYSTDILPLWQQYETYHRSSATLSPYCTNITHAFVATIAPTIGTSILDAFERQTITSKKQKKAAETAKAELEQVLNRFTKPNRAYSWLLFKCFGYKTAYKQINENYIRTHNWLEVVTQLHKKHKNQLSTLKPIIATIRSNLATGINLDSGIREHIQKSLAHIRQSTNSFRAPLSQ